MKTYRLALIGFGNANQGLAEILQEHASFLASAYKVRFVVVAVCTLSKGSIYDLGGLKLDKLLDAIKKEGSLLQVDAAEHGWDVQTMIANSNADVLVEASFTDLQTGQPATNYIRQALESGRHVVTSNKGPVALYYMELAQLAREKGLYFGVEGTVMSGTPAIHLGLGVLKSAGIRKVAGILNGTTNYILTQMEAGADYQAALAEAQRLGYAEADPTGDVEGFDTAGKIVILSNLLFDRPLEMRDVHRTGISHLTSADIEQARQAGERWKLIGSLEEKDGVMQARVSPLRLPFAHPLANVSGATNAITFDTKILGPVTLIGPGAGRQATGYALLSDLLAIHASK